MRKIIGFKLGLKVAEIQRRAKKAKLDLAAAGFAEPELQALVESASRALRPAVLFETFPHSDPDQARLSSMPGLAFSLVLATLGDGAEPARPESGGALPEGLWPVVVDLALEKAVAFASGLLQEDAQKESCELSPSSALSEPAALEAAVKKLDGSKIGVNLADGRLSPSASAAVSLSWLSKSKARGKAK